MTNTERIAILYTKFDLHVLNHQYDDAQQCLNLIETLEYRDERLKDGEDV